MSDIMWPGPFLKWPGGKRQLLREIVKRLPKKYDRYIEPFVGGGTVFFELNQKNAIINDINPALINAYQQIKEHPYEFIEIVEEYDQGIIDGRRLYYDYIKSEYNRKMLNGEYDLELSAMFVFLNKHCYNGLYRVNRMGLFNVPYNNLTNRSCERDNILLVSDLLQSATILCGDFQNACDYACSGNFVFIDSPYDGKTFTSYTKDGFDDKSHRRLSEVFDELTDKGVYCMLTNHNTQFISELYEKYNKSIVTVRRSINSDPLNRVGEEIIITNYELGGVDI